MPSLPKPMLISPRKLNRMGVALGLGLVCAFGAAGLGGCGLLQSEQFQRAELREFSLHAYDEGLRFSEDGNHQVALDRFVRSSVISPRPAAFFQMGRMYELLGDPEQAAVSYMTALELAPDYQEARFALLALDHPAPGEADIKSDPELFGRFSKELMEEVEMRQIEAAEGGEEMTPEERAELRERISRRMALAAEGRLPTLTEVRGVLFAGPLEGAELPSATDPTFARDREIVLNTYPYHFANGQRFQRNREYEKAASEYQKALQAEPGQMDARLNLGDCMLRLERYQQALFHFTKARDYFPQSASPLLKLGNYYDSLSQTARARDYYRESLGIDPEYIEALNNLAAIEIRGEDYIEAITLLRRVTEIDPTYALAWLNIGVAHENSGNLLDAIEAYKRYVELGGDQAAEVRKWIAELE